MEKDLKTGVIYRFFTWKFSKFLKNFGFYILFLSQIVNSKSALQRQLKYKLRINCLPDKFL